MPNEDDRALDLVNPMCPRCNATLDRSVRDAEIAQYGSHTAALLASRRVVCHCGWEGDVVCARRL